MKTEAVRHIHFEVLPDEKQTYTTFCLIAGKSFTLQNVLFGTFLFSVPIPRSQTIAIGIPWQKSTNLLWWGVSVMTTDIDVVYVYLEQGGLGNMTVNWMSLVAICIALHLNDPPSMIALLASSSVVRHLLHVKWAQALCVQSRRVHPPVLSALSPEN